MGESEQMHWKVKALSGVLVINLALLLSIGMWLLVNRPSDEDEPKPVAPRPVAEPEEVPPLPAPEDLDAEAEASVSSGHAGACPSRP